MNPRRATASNNLARSSRFGASAVSRDGVRVNSSHDISQSAERGGVAVVQNGASVPCETRTNGASNTYRASPAGLKSPGSKSRPFDFLKLRASTRVCARTKSVFQIASMIRLNR